VNNSIQHIRDRYDGRKRSPFDEAECGHHYARAMASWAAVPALSGFHYSGVEKSMTFTASSGTYFWSNGYAWGNCFVKRSPRGTHVELSVLHGHLTLSRFSLQDYGSSRFKDDLTIPAGCESQFEILPVPAAEHEKAGQPS